MNRFTATRFDVDMMADDGQSGSRYTSYLAVLQFKNEIELLASETGTPFDIVRAIYNEERAKLDRNARIKTYIPVLTYRLVKDILQSLRSSIH